MNKSQFPDLAYIAYDYLVISATSVSAKQCFFMSKNLITKKRNCLLDKTVRACMCLKSWWQGPLASNN